MTLRAIYGTCSTCGQRIKRSGGGDWYHTGTPPGWPSRVYDHQPAAAPAHEKEGYGEEAPV